MDGEWRIVIEPIEGDDESCTLEQEVVINQLVCLLEGRDFEITDYPPLGKLQADKLIEELNKVILERISAYSSEQKRNSFASKLMKLALLAAGVGVVLSVFGDDGEG